jgi:hypothetical protein
MVSRRWQRTASPAYEFSRLVVSSARVSNNMRFATQSTPLVAGIGIAGAAFVAKQAVQAYIKFASQPAGVRAFYKVRDASSTFSLL